MAALVAVLVVALGRGGGEKAGSSEETSHEEVTQTYEQVKQQADNAVEEMEDHSMEEAVSDPETYEQELQEAEEAFNELYQDLEEASEYLLELGEEYAELYDYIWDYYEYLYGLTEEAVEEIDYLLSIVPSLEQVQELENLLLRLESLPRDNRVAELAPN